MEILDKNNNRYKVYRAVGKIDAQDILNLQKKLTVSFQEFMPKTIDELNKADIKDEIIITNFMQQNGSFLVVRNLKSEIVGACSMLYYRDIKKQGLCDLGVAIDPDYHGLGLGTSLIGIQIQQAKKDFKRKIQLNVFVENEKAIRLYEKIGFRKEVYRKNSICRGGIFYDDIIMGLEFDDYKLE